MNQIKNNVAIITFAILGFFATISTATISFYFLDTLRTSMLEAKKHEVKNMVDSAYSFVMYNKDLSDKHLITEEEAKRRAIDALHKMRFDGSNYFWINDTTTPYPKMILHPSIPSLEGKIMDDKKFNCATAVQYGNDGQYVEIAGKPNIFVEFSKVCNANGSGFVGYNWPKPQNNTALTSIFYPKISYVKKIPGWDWIIGSGIYVEDVDELYSKTATKVYIAMFVALAVYITLIPLLAIKLIRHQNEIMNVNAKLAEQSNKLEVLNAEIDTSYEQAKNVNKIIEVEKAKYIKLLDFAADGIHILDVHGNLIQCSRAFANMLGHDFDHMQGMNILDWENKLDVKAVQHSLEKLLLHPITFETTFKKKDGSTIEVEVSAKSIVINDETYIYASARDISERKRYEESLIKQKEEFETIFNTSKDGIAILDLKSNFLDFNNTYLEMTGFTKEELLNTSCIALSAPEDISRAYEAMKQVFEIGYVKDFEKTCIVKDGKRITINMALSLMPDRQRVLISTKDVTDRIIQETLLHKQKEEFESIFRSSKDGIAIVDLSTRFLDFNDAYLELTGITREELLNKTCIELSVEKDQFRTKEAIEEALRTGYVKNFEKSCIFDGRHIDVNISIALLPDKQRLLLITKDITERKILENKLIQTNEHLAELVEQETAKRLDGEKLLLQQSKMAMMGEMIGAIAHQWRQPLNSLGLLIQDTSIAYALDELNEEYMDKFQVDTMSTIKRMSQTIEDFRNFFKPNKEKADFRIDEAISATLNIISPQLNSHGIEIVAPANADSMVNGYKNELEQAILIVLSNAQDALLHKKIQKPKIVISVTSTDGRVELCIQDNAGGVPAGIIDRIFEPYFTTKHQAHGTGIGLYMAKEIVERQMNGRLYVENVDDGARFTMEL